MSINFYFNFKVFGNNRICIQTLFPGKLCKFGSYSHFGMVCSSYRKTTIKFQIVECPNRFFVALLVPRVWLHSVHQLWAVFWMFSGNTAGNEGKRIQIPQKSLFQLLTSNRVNSWSGQFTKFPGTRCLWRTRSR